MKRLLSLILSLLLAVSLVACGKSDSPAGDSASGKTESTFMAGFGMMDITPKDAVPLGSYGDAKDRISTGLYSYLEARAVVVQDENGDMLVFAVGDVSWCPSALGSKLKLELSKELDIPETHIILSGTHTHASVETSLTEMPSVVAFNQRYIDGMKKAVHMAIEDLKPAQAFEGSIQTEGLNFVRRYIMDDGSLIGDGARGTGTVIVRHETEVDSELQLLKFVREGGKDILIANFQCHPHMEGKTTNISAQVVGTFRDAVESEMDVHCLYWQGAAGNINSKSRIAEENRTSDRIEWGKLLCGYAKQAYDTLSPVATGPVKVEEVTYTGKVNHSRDHLVEEAQDVKDYFNKGHTTSEAGDYGYEKYGIVSIQSASRILANAKLGETKDMLLAAWSFGEIAGVVLPYELFDVSGMQIKDQSPFARTFIVGYAYPAYSGYIPADYAYDIGGYEVDNSTFAKGTAEEMVTEYLGMLENMHK